MWMVALRPYYTADQIRTCPMATRTRNTLPNPWDTTINATALAWGIMGSHGYPVLSWGFPGLSGSYGINGWTHNPPVGVGGIINGNDPGFWRKLAVAGSAKDVPVFADCMWDGSEPLPTDALPSGPGLQNPASAMSDFCN
jgi:hypothetical protein